MLQARTRNPIRQPATHELNSERTGNQHGRQYSRVITRKLSAWKTERHHPQQEPEENKLTPIAKLAPEE